MSGEKSAGVTWRNDSQPAARDRDCADWVLDKAFTSELLTNVEDYYAEIIRRTEPNRSSYRTFE
jgi:hypothetical protein